MDETQLPTDGIYVQFWQWHAMYREKVETIDDAISFAKVGHDSDCMAMEGIIVFGKLYLTSDTWINDHKMDTWGLLREQLQARFDREKVPFELTVMLAKNQIEQVNAGCPADCEENPHNCNKDPLTMPPACRTYLESDPDDDDCGCACCYR